MNGYSVQHPVRKGIRDVAIPVVAVAAAAMLPFYLLVHAFIVLGQAHFALTYLYQWRGNRMTNRYRILALLLLASFSAYFIWFGAALPLMVLITVLFSFHFAWDELTLHDEAPTKGRIVSVIGFTLAFFLLSMLFLMPDASWLKLAASSVGLGAIALRCLIERAPPSRAEWYLWFVEALLFSVALFLALPGHVLAVIVILHVLNWYIGYGARVASDSSRAKRYWRDVAISLCAVIALFLAYRGLLVEPLAFFFGLGPYYAWATAHIVLSLEVALGKRLVS